MLRWLAKLYMLIFLQIVILGLCLAGCQTPNLRPVTDQISKQSDIHLAGINTNKWIAENQDTSETRLTVYSCNHPTCPKGTAVSYLVTKSSLAQYGSKTIEQTFIDAKKKLEGEGAVFSANYPARFKGFMAIKRDYRKEYSGTLKFLSSTIFFTKDTQVVIAAAASDAKSARKYRDEFVSKLEIKDGGTVAQ